MRSRQIQALQADTWSLIFSHTGKKSAAFASMRLRRFLFLRKLFQVRLVMAIARRLLPKLAVPAQNANKKTIQLTLACAGETPEEYADDSGAGERVVEALKRRNPEVL